MCLRKKKKKTWWEVSKVINKEPLYAGIITCRYSNVVEWTNTNKKRENTTEKKNKIRKLEKNKRHSYKAINSFK